MAAVRPPAPPRAGTSRPGERRGERVLDGEDEVGGHEAVEARGLEVGEQRRALARLRPVEAVVGAHHRVGRGLADRALERRLVDLLQRPLGDEGVHVALAPRRSVEADAAPLGVVGDVVLERRDHVAALGAGDLLGHRLAREERVLAEVLGLAPRQRRARDVHRRPQPPVEALAARLGADRLAVGAGQAAVEGRRQRLRRRQRRRAVGADAARPVVGGQGGDAEARPATRSRRAPSRPSGRASSPPAARRRAGRAAGSRRATARPRPSPTRRRTSTGSLRAQRARPTAAWSLQGRLRRKPSDALGICQGRASGMMRLCGRRSSSPASTTRCSRRPGAPRWRCSSASGCRSTSRSSRPAAGRCTPTRATGTRRSGSCGASCACSATPRRSSRRAGRARRWCARAMSGWRPRPATTRSRRRCATWRRGCSSSRSSWSGAWGSRTSARPSITA